jgi:glycosyltransferase involved in cell wall biosynthesis
MKVLHFITSLKIGGAESSLCNYLAAVVEDKSEQHFVAYIHSGPNVERIRKIGVPVFQLSGKFLSYSPFILFKLAKLVRKIKPDLIHSSLWSANIISRIFCKIWRIPLICDLHGDSSHEGIFRNIFDRATVFVPAKIVAVSDSVKKSYLENIIRAANLGTAQTGCEKKLVIIKNGIDVELLQAKALNNKLWRGNFGIVEHDFVIGSVGRLEPIKSYDVLIKAFGLFINNVESNNAKLLIVGGGSQTMDLQNLVYSLGLQDKVIFAGYRSDSHSFYPLFDCFVLSSKSEGLSIALLEALAFGLPVVSTHHGKDHDVIHEGVNGLLVEPENINELASAIQKIYFDLDLRRHMSTCNMRLVKECFSMIGVVDKYKKIYCEVIELNKM